VSCVLPLSRFWFALGRLDDAGWPVAYSHTNTSAIGLSAMQPGFLSASAARVMLRSTITARKHSIWRKLSTQNVRLWDWPINTI
jgi:hypothetical protein